MTKSVKIRTLIAPEGDLTEFDPGRYLSELEFYETDDPVTEEDRDGLAQFVHYLAFLALARNRRGGPTLLLKSKVLPSSRFNLILGTWTDGRKSWPRMALHTDLSLHF